MTHDEMIEVLQAHRDGMKIKVKRKNCSMVWAPTDRPNWNFDECDYCIAEPRWRDATIDDLKRAPLKCRVKQFEDYEWISRELTGYDCSKPSWKTEDCYWWSCCQVIDE